jgi:uncharacterized protein (TIGR02186 family)
VALGMPMRKFARLSLWVAAALLTSTMPAWSAKIRVYPDVVQIGAFFQGTEVSLEGQMPPGCEAVVEVCGPEVNETLLRKGRRAGLWMSVGELEVQHAPNFYLVLSTPPRIPELNGQDTPWGFNALRSRLKIRGALADQEKDRFSSEFLKLKESEELYGSLPGTLRVGNPPEGQAVFQGGFRLPAKVPPGRYQVRLSVVKDGQILEQKTETLEVRMVGFPALLAALAYEHGALYGILAVAIAIATGFLMGFLFKGKAGH